MKFLFKLTVLILVIFFNVQSAVAFSYFTFNYDEINSLKNNNVSIGYFDFAGNQSCLFIIDLFIDQTFYDTYMTLNLSGEYVWKRDQYNNIINANEIKSLTPLGTIIKSDICYEVISTKYNLIDHGIPNENTPLNWALRPVKLDYVLGWAYSKNRVVKTIDNNYFMARFYTTANPLTNRTGWDKIEPVIDTNFEFYENSTVPNYSKPYLNQIRRSYIWDAYTTYTVGDVVTYNGVEYIAISSSNNKTPSTNAWAWEEL